MSKYEYCSSCRRIFEDSSTCPFCESAEVSELNLKSPVNIIGTKIKGRIFNMSDNSVKVLTEDGNRSKSIKEYEASKLRKIL